MQASRARWVLAAVLVAVAIAKSMDGQMAGRTSRRGGVLVAELRPYRPDPETMARQKLCKNACSGHGVCVVQEGSMFPPACTCFYLWSESDCSKALCPSDCHGNGFCNHTNGYCVCNKGMTGTDCSIDTRVGSCPNNCTGHGLCHDGRCSCFRGWVGADCAVAPCPGNCSGHGSCATQDPVFGGSSSCVCEEGFTGSDCTTIHKKCPGDDKCSGHGVCNRYTGECTCSDTYTGPGCEQLNCGGYFARTGQDFPPPYAGCPNDCSCHGYCVCTDVPGGPPHCYCACEPGWVGEACDLELGSKVINPFPSPSPVHGYQSYPEDHTYTMSLDEQALLALKRSQMKREEVAQQENA